MSLDEIIVILMCGVFTCLSSAYLFNIIKDVYYSIKSIRWPSNNCEIVQSKLCYEEDEYVKKYYVDIEYVYDINKDTYRSNIIQFGYTMTDDYKYHKNICDTYKLGSTVNLFYCPFDPKLSTLIVGLNKVLLLKFSIILFCLIVSLFMIISVIL